MQSKLMDIQRLRNLTTGMLHTKIEHMYQDLEFFYGEQGFMTHMIPIALHSLKPFLEKRFDALERLWDGEYDPNHKGEVLASPLTSDEKTKALEALRLAILKGPGASNDRV